MRISVVPSDEGYVNSGLREKANVYLDGVKQRFCVTADEEQGVVVRYVVKNGDLSIDGSGGTLEVETVKGKVVIEIKNGNSRP